MIYRYKLIFIFSLLFWLNSAMLLQAAAPPMPLDQYWADLARTQTKLADFAKSPPPDLSAQLAAEADHWSNITQVILPDGQQLTVNHSFLASQLRAPTPDLAKLQTLLTTMQTAHQNWPSPQHSTTDLTPLVTILNGAEFQWLPPPSPSFLEQLWEQFLRLLARLFPSNVLGWSGSIGIQYLIRLVGVLLFIAVVAFILWDIRANLIIEASIEDDELVAGERLTADLAMKQAQTLSGQGDYRTAVRYLYLSALLILEERGLLRYDRTKTNREYVRSLTEQPKLAQVLREVIDVFDRVWYGYQTIDESTYTYYAAQVAELRQQS